MTKNFNSRNCNAIHLKQKRRGLMGRKASGLNFPKSLGALSLGPGPLLV